MNEPYKNPGFIRRSDKRTAPGELKHLCCHFPLPHLHGGYIEACFELKKGTRPLHGCDPDTGQLESYFSTQDDATLELTLTNKSHYHIHHARVCDVRIMSYHGADEGLQYPDKELKEPNDGHRLPDGNAFIEIIPNDAYYGHLHPHDGVSKYFSVITRGTAPGCYYVCMELDYSIDNCKTHVHLPLEVKSD
ncbi:MAG: hypothetical protein MJE77_06265 [Proteobacteria bacterium]|nr:hypothetical protein [Pseudomonadota bacterium]